MTEEESAPLLDFLFEHQIAAGIHLPLQLARRSLAFWDNRCALHNPVND